MSEQEFSWKYEVVLSIEGLAFNDIVYFVNYRMPTVYAASFARMCVVLPPKIIHEIERLIGKSRFPHCNVQIYSPDDETGERVREICNKAYRISALIGPKDIQLPQQHVILQLINPILYKMSVTWQYDKRLDWMTGKQILDDYHGFLSNNYGDHFKVNYICDSNDFYDHQFEETLIYDRSDLHVPFNIIKQRCPSSFYPVYFFDDFYFPPSGEQKDVTIQYIDFLNKDQHQNAEDFIKYEGTLSAHTERIVPIGDFAKQLDKDNASEISKTYVDSKNMVSSPDRKERGRRFQLETDTDSVQLTSEKSLMSIDEFVQSKIQIDQSGYEMNITFPDSRDNLADRINTCYNFFKEGPANVHYVSSHYALLDWVHFGFRYAIDPDEPQEFRFVPFNIVNIFRRELKDPASHREDTETKPIWCKYYAKVAFFEYIDDD